MSGPFSNTRSPPEPVLGLTPQDTAMQLNFEFRDSIHQCMEKIEPIMERIGTYIDSGSWAGDDLIEAYLQ